MGKDPHHGGNTGAPLSLCVIGCGPRGASIVERILANVPALYGDRPLDLHVVDPYPPGAGRTWRTDQPGLLWMNSAADQVTMYPDESVACAGPPRPGPTTAAWLGAPLHDGAYAARRDQGRYLRRFFAEVTGARPASVRLHLHRARAVDLLRTAPYGGPGRQRVVLDSGRTVLADRVVLAQGHVDTLAAPAPPGLTRIGPGPADPDALDRIPAGAPVVVRGLGLVFIDCLALLTEGRGGRFSGAPGGPLRYLPSGREPRLYAGSRRGVPLPPKPSATAPGAPDGGLRFATPGACRAALARPGASFGRDVWPLVLAELAWRHYRALFATAPDRTCMTWQDFDAQYALLFTDAGRLAKLARAAVPDPADRFDLDRPADPLSGRRFTGGDDLQRQLRAHLAETLRRRTGPAAGPELALVDGLRRTGEVVEELWRSGDLDDASVADALRRFAVGTYLSSGPPPLRARQLLALSEAGVVTFVGPGMRVETGPAGFRALSPAVPGAVHEAAVLLDARLAPADPDRVADPLLRALAARGELAPDPAGEGGGQPRLSGAELHPVAADGTVHRDRIVVGPAQFPRPQANAVAFRQNDAVARRLLTG
ncbi:adenylate cyclase [Streptomyces albospinus]|uniref:Adenylate cyclase n=1 Tax=Streptomyces albospinus TaxID=285515 RepID=A0ABQ2UZA8_9ACTN|nr:FAD/NAD(P)-binding protein [Streptomyces albospinus]GGU59556.1 adenylate cyclase [Streptomyces albospinus]